MSHGTSSRMSVSCHLSVSVIPNSIIGLILCIQVSLVCVLDLCFYHGTAGDCVLPLHDGFE